MAHAEADPDTLATVLSDALNATAAAQAGISLRVEHLEHFRPSRPTPTHRDLVVTSTG